jgi:hypothetical protein
MAAADGPDDWVAPTSVPVTQSASDGHPNDWVAPPPTGQPEANQSPGYARDIARGVATGAVRGAASVLGFPSDVWQMLDRGYQWVLTKGAEKMGLMTPEEGAALRQPIPGLEDYKFGSENIYKHLAGLAQSMGADTNEPQTVPGQYAETMTSFLPGAAAFGASSAKEVPTALTRYGLLPGAASETAGQVTKGTDLEPYARMAGAIGPETGWQAFNAGRRMMSPMRGIMDNVTPVQEAQSQELLERSREAGAPLLSSEAVQQVTGNATRLGDLQRVVEQSPKGAAIIRPLMAQRPAATDAMGRSMLDQIGPGTMDPFEVAPKVQGASNQAVSDAAAARTAAVDPFYQRANTDRVPLADMNQFLGRIDNMIASDKTGIMGPELSHLRESLIETPGTPGTPGIPAQRIANTTPTGATIYRTTPAVPAVAPTPPVPITDIENLDRVRKYFRDRLDLPQWAQDATSKEEGAKVGSLLNDLRQRMVSASSDFAAGKNLYQNITENTFSPLTRSPTGQLAAAETYPQQAQILFNPNPPARSAGAVGRAVRVVARADPDAAAELVRLHLENTFNEATQNNLPGPNQFGGPKFAAVVSGNSQQAKNLQAAVTALPDGNLRWQAWQKGMQILEAMGTRQPVGSQTAFNAQIQKWMAQGNPATEFLVGVASPGTWPKVASAVYRHVVFDQNTERLARLFTEGNVADLRDIARAGARSFQGQAALIGALAHQGDVSTQSPQ